MSLSRHLFLASIAALFVVATACTSELAHVSPELTLVCGPQSSALVEPSSATSCPLLDFGKVPVETSATLLLRIGNAGRAVLTVSASSGIDGNASGMLTAAAPPTTIEPGTSADIAITFTPLYDVTLKQKYLLITNDPTQPTLTIPIIGEGDGHPLPELSAQELDFGGVLTGSTKFLSVQISNAGNEPMTILSSTMEGDTAEFVVPAAGGIVGPAESVGLSIGFHPRGPGDDDRASVVLTFDSVDQFGNPTGLDVTTLTVALHGDSVPNLGVSPTAVRFAQLSSQQVAKSTVSAVNNGLAPAHITSISLSDDTSLDINFQSMPSLPILMQPGEMLSDLVDLIYSPPTTTSATLASDSGTLLVTTDDPAHLMWTIPISGGCVCAPPGPVIQVSPRSTDFASVAPGYGTRTAQFVVSSVGTLPVQVFGILPSASTPSDFTIGTEIPAGTMIAPGGSKVFSVTYTEHPRSPWNAPVDGVVNVNSNDPSKPTIPLTLTAQCSGNPDGSDLDDNGIPTACESCTLHKTGGVVYFPNGLTGDGITFTGAVFDGQSSNVLLQVAPGAPLKLDFDWQITGEASYCQAGPSTVTQFYVGVGADSSGCLYAGDSCTDQNRSSRPGSVTFNAPMTAGTYFVQYDWLWSSSVCGPEEFVPTGDESAFAAFCVGN